MCRRQWAKYKAVTFSSALFLATLNLEKNSVCFLGFRLVKGAGVGLSVRTGNDSQHLWITTHGSDSGSSLPKPNYYFGFQWKGISRQSQLLQEVRKLTGVRGYWSQDDKHRLFLKIKRQTAGVNVLHRFHQATAVSLVWHVVRSRASCLSLHPQQPLLLIYRLSEPNPPTWLIYWPCMKSKRWRTSPLKVTTGVLGAGCPSWASSSSLFHFTFSTKSKYLKLKKVGPQFS